MAKENILKKAFFTLQKEEEAVKSVRKIIGGDFLKAVEILSGAKGKIIVSGMGKSGQIGMKIASTLTSLNIPSIFLNPAEAMHGDLGLVGADDAIIAISSSGGTKELLRVVNHLKHLLIPIVAITGNKKSSLAKASRVSLAFKIKEEGSPFNLAPMASSTASLVIGDILAAALSAKKGFGKKDFADFHPGGMLGLKLSKVENLMVKGLNVPIIKENDSFYKAAKEISAKKLGIAGVVNKKGEIVGIISDGDIRRFILTGKSLDKAEAADAMTKNPKTIGKDNSLEEALIIMEKNKITSLFVADRRKKPIGVIHIHHIIEGKLI
ncbi:KpsF/GutQ family sugar-phosphate isomerase [Candidatus Wolfebacteria bacterium]|nr:KpsF/GutQ family sugar-phosphate isomerase [Candidatus Wolfebacteria bacterium]